MRRFPRRAFSRLARHFCLACARTLSPCCTGDNDLPSASPACRDRQGAGGFACLPATGATCSSHRLPAPTRIVGQSLLPAVVAPSRRYRSALRPIPLRPGRRAYLCVSASRMSCPVRARSSVRHKRVRLSPGPMEAFGGDGWGSFPGGRVGFPRIDHEPSPHWPRSCAGCRSDRSHPLHARPCAVGERVVIGRPRCSQGGRRVLGISASRFPTRQGLGW